MQYQVRNNWRTTQPPGGGKAHGPFLEFLATIYRILGIKASAENQAKAAINFVMKKYPKT
jgi:hypothetical protein